MGSLSPKDRHNESQEHPAKKQIEEASGKKRNGLKKEASENARGQEECVEKSEEADPREVNGSQKEGYCRERSSNKGKPPGIAADG